MPRTSSVDLASAVALLAATQEEWKREALLTETSERLLELRKLAAEALPAVELFGERETLRKLKLELGL